MSALNKTIVANLAIFFLFCFSTTASPPEVSILSPEEGEELRMGDMVIAISFYDEDGDIDLKSIVLEIDGVSVVENAKISPDILIYIPEERLDAGVHEIVFSLRDTTGNEVGPIIRKFKLKGEPIYEALILGKIEKPPTRIRFTGSLTFDSRFDKIEGDSAAVSRRNEPEWTNKQKLELNIGYKDFNCGCEVFLTSDESGSAQPRNKFRGVLSISKFKLMMGDVNLFYSNLVLSGIRTRGIDFRYETSDMFTDFVWGEIRRPIEGVVEGDTLLKQSGTYARKILGIMRISKTSGGFFNFGGSLLKIKDDINSIENGLKPKDNLVAGIVTGFNFPKKVTLSGEFAASILTNDISGGAADEDIEGINPKNISDLIVLNESTSPLILGDPSSFAWEANLKTSLPYNTFNFSYRSIGPAYNSLGSPSLQNDRAGFKLHDVVSGGGKKGRVSAQFTYERLNDNLSDNKEYTTTFSKLSTNIGLYLAHFPTLNFMLRLNNKKNEISDDNTKTYSIGGGRDFDLGMMKLKPILNFLQLMREDTFDETKEMNTNVFSLFIRGEFNFPLTCKFGFTTTTNEYEGMGAKSRYNIFNIGGDYRLFEDKLRIFFESGFSSGSQDDLEITEDYNEESDSEKQFYNLGLGYESDNSSVLFSFGFVDFNDTEYNYEYDDRNYNEKVLKLEYTRRF